MEGMLPEQDPAAVILPPMEIRNSFVVGAVASDLWGYLLDVEKIAPCLPGAELTEVVDDRTWKGRVQMKFGPVAMTFAGTVTLDERNDTDHRARLTAKGMEQQGKGAANATIASWLEPGPGDAETTVEMVADITLTGAAAQMSRGLLPEISKQLTQQFADCLQQQMSVERTSGDTAAPPIAPPAAPVGGLSLGISAAWSIIRRFFARLFGGGKRS
jgi:carbon monoxide dehydrogenase subunit G